MINFDQYLTPNRPVERALQNHKPTTNNQQIQFQCNFVSVKGSVAWTMATALHKSLLFHRLNCRTFSDCDFWLDNLYLSLVLFHIIFPFIVHFS